ncbi:hypothetical protein L915_12909 [Phytophthora nicotianae]|uniref:Uncharacterized protein n=1 Tax=Phytophthora nicotianae TaxID=4792 RepID=W2GF37_PHYNI|nr:hypothetical protein L915_12909 [Phytophthora nicotianae]ETL35010.1 hypothetical protein L916_12817 [Phytophthora nicotianae]
MAMGPLIGELGAGAFTPGLDTAQFQLNSLEGIIQQL